MTQKHFFCYAVIKEKNGQKCGMAGRIKSCNLLNFFANGYTNIYPTKTIEEAEEIAEEWNKEFERLGVYNHLL